MTSAALDRTPRRTSTAAGARAARARTGVSVTLVDRKKEGLIPYIQKKAGVAFERIGAPQPAQMAQIAGESTSSPRTFECLAHQNLAAIAD